MIRKAGPLFYIVMPSALRGRGTPYGAAAPAEMVLILRVGLDSNSSEKVPRVCGGIKERPNMSL